MNQRSLFVESVADASGLVAAAVIPKTIGTPAAERKRLSRQCEAILERLQRGTASNSELAAMALNYRARVSDLRAAGYTIEVVERNHDTGLNFYELR